MSFLLQLRDVSGETLRARKGPAAAQERSLNAYLLELIDREAARPTFR